MMLPKSLRPEFWLLALLLAAIGCDKAQVGYESPQAALDAHYGAYKAEDFDAAFDALTPESQHYAVGQLLLVISAHRDLEKVWPENSPDERVRARRKAIVEDQLRYESILRRFGVAMDLPASESVDLQTDEGISQVLELGRAVQNQRAFYGEVQAIVNQSRDWSRYNWVLENLSIDGDTARGSVVVQIESKSVLKHEVEFHRLNSGWLMHLVGMERRSLEKYLDETPDVDPGDLLW